jgi:large repetitive protein
MAVPRALRRVSIAALALLATGAIVPAAQAYSVNLKITGAGSVTTTETTPHISCYSPASTPTGVPGATTGSCSYDFGSFSGGITLVPSTTYGWTFTGWTGCPTVSGNTCQIGGLFQTDAFAPTAVFVDTKNPTVSLTLGPGGVSSSSSATFIYDTDEDYVTFLCAVDNGTRTECGTTRFGYHSGSVTYNGLADGSHTFTVVARDPSGHVSATASRTWTVDGHRLHAEPEQLGGRLVRPHEHGPVAGHVPLLAGRRARGDVRRSGELFRAR